MSTDAVEGGARMLRKEMMRKPMATTTSSRTNWVSALIHRVFQVTCWFSQMI